MKKIARCLPIILASLSTTPCFSALLLQETKGNTASNTWQVTIQNPSEQTLDITISPDALVYNIKDSISQKEDISIDSQKLLFEGDTLEDSKKISVYGIQNGDILQLVPSSQAGIMPFVFSTFKSQVEEKFSDTAPEWREIAKGLNLQGICKNKKCKAYNKKVWIKKGFGTFNLGQEVHTSICPMPNCQEEVDEVEECGFFYCKYRIQGKKSNKEKVDISDFHKEKNGFVHFKAGGEDSAEYLFLNVTVTKY